MMNGSPNDDDDKEMFKFSIWLLPSSRERGKLSKMIQGFSQHEAASVPFPPHVTVVGGIPCASEDHWENSLLPSLQEGIQKNCGQMKCEFSTEPVYHPKWNQACVLVMEESTPFTELVGRCRQIALEDSSVKDWYPPPLRKPHLSLYYGEEGVGAPKPEDIVQGLGVNGSPNYSFEASQIAIWKTDPASVEGVAAWKELSVIDLPPASNAKSSL